MVSALRIWTTSPPPSPSSFPSSSSSSSTLVASLSTKSCTPLTQPISNHPCLLPLTAAASNSATPTAFPPFHASSSSPSSSFSPVKGNSTTPLTSLIPPATSL